MLMDKWQQLIFFQLNNKQSIMSNRKRMISRGCKIKSCKKCSRRWSACKMKTKCWERRGISSYSNFKGSKHPIRIRRKCYNSWTSNNYFKISSHFNQTISFQVTMIQSKAPHSRWCHCFFQALSHTFMVTWLNHEALYKTISKTIR